MEAEAEAVEAANFAGSGSGSAKLQPLPPLPALVHWFSHIKHCIKFIMERISNRDHCDTKQNIDYLK